MHLTLNLETTKPAGQNFLQQQARFDDFIDGYNNERPHQAPAMRSCCRSTVDLLQIVEQIGKAGASFRSLGEPSADTTAAWAADADRARGYCRI